ncbi:MAG: pilus assembly protein [Actinomycetota bacterium]|nr:pilus assembly protein [Actinomycetota bacterium]
MLFRRLVRHSRGQATVEFVMVLPVLLIVIAAAFQTTLALNCCLMVSSASREGARRGAETGDSEEAKNAALDAASGLPGEKPNIDVDFPYGHSKGQPIRVRVSHRMPILIPGLEHIIPEVSFTKSTSMSLERE